MVTSTQAKAAVDFLGEKFGISERRASLLLGRPRSTIRYQPKQREEEKELTQAICRFARKHRRFGYRKIHALLKNADWKVNVKRVRSRRAGMEPVGFACASTSKKAEKRRQGAGDKCEQLHEQAGAVQGRCLDVRFRSESADGGKTAQVVDVG